MWRLVTFLRSCSRSIPARGKMLFAVAHAVRSEWRWANGTLSFFDVSLLIGNSGGAMCSPEGQTWTLDTIFTGGTGVVGMDFAVRDGNAGEIVAWTQEVRGESGSSVWESDSGGLPLRVSQPVERMCGFKS